MSPEQLAHVAKLVADHARAIYDWQNYLLWQLLVCKKYAAPELIAVAQKRAAQLNRPADRAGAILYLGALGTEEDRLFVAKLFNTCDKHIVQRNALIAVHELEFNAGIKEHVKDHVMPSLQGTYKRLKDDFPGQYFRPLPAVSVVSIYDEMSAYD
jgi:hypothetical protein